MSTKVKNMSVIYHCDAKPHKCECKETINQCLLTSTSSHCTVENPNYWLCDSSIK